MVVAVFMDVFQPLRSSSLASVPCRFQASQPRMTWLSHGLHAQFVGFSSAFHPSENLVDMTKLQML
jgi:hypothetical protein